MSLCVRPDIERRYGELPADIRLLIEAYTDGVNDAIPEVRPTDDGPVTVALEV